MTVYADCLIRGSRNIISRVDSRAQRPVDLTTDRPAEEIPSSLPSPKAEDQVTSGALRTIKLGKDLKTLPSEMEEGWDDL